MVAPWIFIFIAFLFVFGPLRRRAWRGGPWGYQRDLESWKRERQARESDREEQDRLREEHVETLETRVTELESRLDYAERLLTHFRESSLGLTPPAKQA